MSKKRPKEFNTFDAPDLMQLWDTRRARQDTEKPKWMWKTIFATALKMVLMGIIGTILVVVVVLAGVIWSLVD